MDSSTGAECHHLEEVIGRGERTWRKSPGRGLFVGLIHHGRAYERFTGNQIARFAKNHPAEYEDTERISLVSSFVTSLLRGDFAPIDFSDGCGMNLLNIHTRRWCWSLFVLIRRDARCLDACAPGLEERLGDPRSQLDDSRLCVSLLSGVGACGGREP